MGNWDHTLTIFAFLGLSGIAFEEEKNQLPSRTYFTKYICGEGFYRGEIDRKGRRSGYGLMVWEEGEGESRVYRGHWSKDRMEGEGEMHWKVGFTGIFSKKYIFSVDFLLF